MHNACLVYISCSSSCFSFSLLHWKMVLQMTFMWVCFAIKLLFLSINETRKLCSTVLTLYQNQVHVTLYIVFKCFHIFLFTFTLRADLQTKFYLHFQNVRCLVCICVLCNAKCHPYITNLEIYYLHILHAALVFKLLRFFSSHFPSGKSNKTMHNCNNVRNVSAYD